MNLESEFNSLSLSQKNISHHKIYQYLGTKENLSIFMKHHVFAVWDFMAILKRLQSEITCVHTPWKPSKYDTSFVRMLNEIVLCEESDLDQNGNPRSHFEMYLDAMDEVGSDKNLILKFMNDGQFEVLPYSISNFVRFNLKLCKSAPVHLVASVFFFGREKLIPEIFIPITECIGEKFPILKFYLQRHIEVDGNEHSEMAKKLLFYLCNENTSKLKEAISIAHEAISLRNALWTGALKKIQDSQVREIF